MIGQNVMVFIPAISRELCEIPKKMFRAAPAGLRRGYLSMRAYDGGPEVQADLVQCCHCQHLFVYVVGSGVKRGWCMNCNGITCGCNECDMCVPSQQLIANMGAGLLFDQARQHRPIMASVPCKVPKTS